MHYRGVVAALLLNAAPLLAVPVQPSLGALAPDEHLSVWLAADPAIKEKLARAEAPPFFAEPGLKDAVADRPAILPPEIQAPRQPDCRDFQSCAVPPLAMDIPAGEPVEPAIVAMMRPWMWLADAAGVRLGVAHGGAESQTLLAMNLKGLGLTGVGLNIAPRPDGGVHLWFSRGFELADTYSRERAEAIPRSRK